MKLTVNGEPHEHQGDGTIDALLDELELATCFDVYGLMP